MTTLVAVAGALLGAGGLAALLQARSLSRKTGAEAEVTLGGGWKELVADQRTEIAGLRERVAAVEALRKEDAEVHRTELNKVRDRVVVVESLKDECLARLAKLEVGDRAAVERIVGDLLDQAIAQREAK